MRALSEEEILLVSGGANSDQDHQDQDTISEWPDLDTPDGGYEDGDPNVYDPGESLDDDMIFEEFDPDSEPTISM